MSKLHSKSRNGVKVLTCDGDLNANRMVKIKNRVARLLSQSHHHNRFILDLAKARRVEFSALGILIDRLMKLRAMRGDIRMVRVRPNVAAMFNRLRLDSVIEVFDSKRDALASYHAVG